MSDMPPTIVDEEVPVEEVEEVEEVEVVTDVGRWIADPCIPEGVMTGDGRTADVGSLDWRELPWSLGWQKRDEPGHDGSVVAGSWTDMERRDDRLVAWGDFSAEEDGQELRRLVAEGSMNGLSVDIVDVTSVWEPDLDAIADMDADDDGWEVPYIERITKGTVAGMVACRIPAYAEARIAILASADRPGCYTVTFPVSWAEVDGVLVASMAPHALAAPIEPAPEAEKADTLTAGATVTSIRDRAAVPDRMPFATDGSADLYHPPAEWFKNPGLTEATPMMVDPSGRVFGHLAQFGVPHRGINGRTVLAESTSRDMSEFLQGRVLTSDGTLVSVGVVTVGGPHAALDADLFAARAHYASIGDQYQCSENAVACVAAGWDDVGIWLAGAVAPHAAADQVWQLRSMTQSGDWRGADLKLVASLTVPCGGFPKYGSTLVASGVPMAMVAAGVIERPALSGTDAVLAAFSAKVDAYAERVESLEALVETLVRERVAAAVEQAEQMLADELAE